MKQLMRLLPLALLAFASPAYAQLPTTIDVLDGSGSPVTVPTLQAVIDELDAGIHGGTAVDSAIADKPVTVGGRGSATTPSAMSADGDVTNLWLTLEGAAVVASPALDDAAYSPTTTRPFVAGAVFDDVATDSINEGDAGYVRQSANRNLFTTIRDAAGNERGVNVNASNALSISCSDCVGTGTDDSSASGVAVVYSGGLARSSERTNVTNGDVAAFVADLSGKQIVMLYANPENFVSGAITSAMTGTTSTSLVAAPASGLRNYITQITCSNAHATVGTDIIVQDGSGGTTFYLLPAAAVYGGAAITFPTPLRQPTTATAVYVANVTTGASTKCAASGYKGA